MAHYDETDLPMIVKRIEALEYAMDYGGAYAAQTNRGWLWHKTYNAAWSGLAKHYEPWQLIFADRPAMVGGDAAADKHDETVRARIEWLHLAAVNIANRAHGPLPRACAPCEPETTSEAGPADTVSGSDDGKNA